MTDIEAKRKELIKEWQEEPENIKNQRTREWKICYNCGKLEGFNLGVEMARKEFLELIDKIEINPPSTYFEKYKKLKQSLDTQTPPTVKRNGSVETSLGGLTDNTTATLGESRKGKKYCLVHNFPLNSDGFCIRCNKYPLITETRIEENSK